MLKSDKKRHLEAIAHGHTGCYYGWTNNIYRYIINEMKKHNLSHSDEPEEMFGSIYALELTTKEIESLKSYYFPRKPGQIINN